LLSEPADSPMSAHQPLPEVRDSAPTYAHEAQPSAPHPNPYPAAAPARSAAPGAGAALGALAGGTSAPPATVNMAAAPPMRDPAEWIKAIQKLRTEGKTEQVTKELTEFRRQYPLHPLPDELKLLVN
jgi:hypothetical protein